MTFDMLYSYEFSKWRDQTNDNKTKINNLHHDYKSKVIHF